MKALRVNESHRMGLLCKRYKILGYLVRKVYTAEVERVLSASFSFHVTNPRIISEIFAVYRTYLK